MCPRKLSTALTPTNPSSPLIVSAFPNGTLLFLPYILCNLFLVYFLFLFSWNMKEFSFCHFCFLTCLWQCLIHCKCLINSDWIACLWKPGFLKIQAKATWQSRRNASLTTSGLFCAFQSNPLLTPAGTHWPSWCPSFDGTGSPTAPWGPVVQ